MGKDQVVACLSHDKAVCDVGILQWSVLIAVVCAWHKSHSGAAHQAGLIVIIIIHEVHGDTSLKQNVRAAVNVTY